PSPDCCSYSSSSSSYGRDQREGISTGMNSATPSRAKTPVVSIVLEPVTASRTIWCTEGPSGSMVSARFVSSAYTTVQASSTIDGMKVATGDTLPATTRPTTRPTAAMEPSAIQSDWLP